MKCDVFFSLLLRCIYLFGRRVITILFSMAWHHTRSWLKNCARFYLLFSCHAFANSVHVCVCVLRSFRSKSSTKIHTKIKQKKTKENRPSLKNARMHKYTLPAWHSNKNKNKTRKYTQHTQRVSANVLSATSALRLCLHNSDGGMFLFCVKSSESESQPWSF